MPLSQGQKVFFISALVVAALFTLGLSARRFLQGLVVPPIAALPLSPAAMQAIPAPTGPAGSTIEALKTRDTDGDGLSDADELSRYGTSPYLKDTDSDGVSDGEEIRRGANPLCPEGKTCTPEGILFGGLAAASQATLEPPPLLPQLTQQPSRTAGVPAAAIGTSAVESPEQLTHLLSGQATAQELRAFLKRQGAREQDLAAIDDQSLLALYAQAITQALGASLGSTDNTQPPNP